MMKHCQAIIPIYRSLLPWKGDSKQEIIKKVLTFLNVSVLLVCTSLLINDLILEPIRSDQEQQDVKNIYYSNPQSSKLDTSPSSKASVSSKLPEQKTVPVRAPRFAVLQKVNPNIVGWITVPNTNIDLPVLQADSQAPEFYLTHDYNKNYAAYGSIFADCRAPVSDDNSRSMILYGHSLLSGRMFTQLNKYKALDFYKSAPSFTFDTTGDQSKWKIISVFLTNTLPEQGEPFDYMKTDFKSDSDYLNFVYQLRIRSIYNTGVSFNANDKIVLLSTCSYEFKDFREVVAARKVRAGESNAVKTDRASYNNKVLYPDCWYKKSGEKKPVWPSTYEQAVKDQVLSWDKE